MNANQDQVKHKDCGCSILISAYSCETGRGSEGEIGWRLVLRLAENNDVWVITRANLRPVHDAAFVHTPKPQRLHFVYFDLPWILRFYKKGARFFLVYYYLWQIGIGIKGRKLAKKHHFDVLHHLIGGMDWMPAGLSLVPGKLIWGPIGSENTHPRLRQYLSPASRLKDSLRLIARWWMRYLDPIVRFTGARSSVILSHTPETLPLRYAHKMQPFSQTGIENNNSLARSKTRLQRNETLRVIFAGELKDWKGAKLALDAALRFFEVEHDASLTVVGNGPLRHEMELTAQSHPQGSRVRFMGRVPMDVLVEALHESDVFIYPSFHHGLATIVLQAMLTGLPVVCLEGDATGRAVGHRAGITVPLSDDADPVEGLARALQTLAQNESLRQRLAADAIQMACNDYSYQILGKRVEDIYCALH